MREFHVSREARDRYELDKTLFSLTGNVIFADFRAAREFAQRINEKRDVVRFPERSVRAGELNAMGLVDEILHYVIASYSQQVKPRVMEEALAYVDAQLGQAAVDETLQAFVEQFPPMSVYRGELAPAAYLKGETAGASHRAVALEEMLLLWIANDNPAAEPFLDLFDDAALDEQTPAYPDFAQALEAFFATQPTFGPDNQSLFEMLLSPSRTAPRSWSDQLAYIRSRWSSLLGRYLFRILSSLDLLEEEQKAFFGFGPGPARVPEFEGLAVEPERFSPDQAWMPRAVMLAKNVYVWLDQLSREYGRPIHHLDEVPDEELDLLQRYGFTALWLIGLWERSSASRRIKQMMGNPEAVASAYSIKQYAVAEDVGGEAAFQSLKSRAWARGIRMASDMVPNHVGIDSDWVINHPDWFVSLDYSPFPSYSFSGVDLCDDPRVGIYLEDHYYQRTDAAVVFQRRDHWTGDAKYIYHGNDGTQMPWNDTAQLNYLVPEVREAVIQTIIEVARRSPIIRFDAAMTLAKRHYQRLWFPEPGTGGDIPSRSDFGLTRAEFDERMPEEFWRMVVDRVAAEVPDTLLLAEAFWLMEGYFVRTLGMHRVYNSAFMNMLRDEKNAEYRKVIKNTLEFDPEILRRYVNFMNNPDERTAVDQFGKGDKYFGVCTMMVTMPGLPMFGHGQIQGYAEKYGMEFRKAYWDEQVDQDLVARHERQVFPLVHRRYLYAGVDDFCLYDFYTAGGSVDENVFAYSNRAGDERSLVLYHNRFGDTRGWVRWSAAYAVRDAQGNKTLVQKSLVDGLGIPGDLDRFVIFRDVVQGLEYIRNCRDLEEHGLFVELHAYQASVLMDFRVVEDNESRHYAQLAAYIGGRGVASIDAALKELYLQPVHDPFRMLVSAPAFRWLASHTAPSPEEVDQEMLGDVAAKTLGVLAGILHVQPPDGVAKGHPASAIASEVAEKLALVLSFPGALQRWEETADDEQVRDAAAYLLEAWHPEDWTLWGTLFGWLFTHALGRLVDGEQPVYVSRSWFDEWLLLYRPVAAALEELGVGDRSRERALMTIRMLISYPLWRPDVDQRDVAPYLFLRRALGYREVQAYIGINRYAETVWFNKEFFESLLWWVLCMTVLESLGDEARSVGSVRAAYALIEQLMTLSQASGYQVEALLSAAQDLMTPEG